MENILRTTVGLVNIVFLSELSDATVSAVSISNQYILISTIIAMAVANGSIIYINQAIGMKVHNRINRIAMVALCMNITLGLLFGILFLAFAGPLLTIMEMDGGMIHEATVYIRIVGGAMAVACAETILSNLCRSTGRTRAPLAVNLTANIINIIGCYIVIFTPWGRTLPSVAGVAVVNVLSRLGGLSLAVFFFSKTIIKLKWSDLKPFPIKELKMVLAIGIPTCMNNIAYSMSQLITTAIITQTGVLMVAAKIYVTNLVQYIGLVGIACGQAGMILVGYRFGAGDIAGCRKICKRVVSIALVSNMSFSLLMISMRMPLLRIFTDDTAILTVAAGVMMLDFFVEIGRGLNTTLSTSLQACGDVLFQLIVNQLSGWLVAVGGAYLLGIVLGWGLRGVWIAFAADELTRGLILLFRWRKSAWLKKAMLRRDKLGQS